MTDFTFDDAAVRRIRSDFPYLDRQLNGHPLAYLDSAATGQRPRVVLDSERAFLEHQNAAVHRGANTLVGEATSMFEDARETVAAFVGAAPNETVWTSNATDAINMVALGIADANAGLGGGDAEVFRLGPDDEIVVTEAEHHANLIPWQRLAAAPAPGSAGFPFATTAPGPSTMPRP